MAFRSEAGQHSHQLPDGFSVLTMPLGQQPWHEAPLYPRGGFHAVKEKADHTTHTTNAAALSAGQAYARLPRSSESPAVRAGWRGEKQGEAEPLTTLAVNNAGPACFHFPGPPQSTLSSAPFRLRGRLFAFDHGASAFCFDFPRRLFPDEPSAYPH